MVSLPVGGSKTDPTMDQVAAPSTMVIVGISVLKQMVNADDVHA